MPSQCNSDWIRAFGLLTARKQLPSDSLYLYSATAAEKGFYYTFTVPQQLYKGLFFTFTAPQQLDKGLFIPAQLMAG